MKSDQLTLEPKSRKVFGICGASYPQGELISPRSKWDLIGVQPTESHFVSTRLAWAAGFLDGEGCIQISKAPPRLKSGNISPRYMLILSAKNTKLEPILRLKSLFGGRITPKQEKGNKKLIYLWEITGTQMHQALEQLLPYLSCKYEQAHLALEFHKAIAKGFRQQLTRDQLDFKELCYQKMRVLNSIGRKSYSKGKQLELTNEGGGHLPRSAFHVTKEYISD